MTDREQTMLIFAARYAHNRHTGAALMVVSEAIEKWDALSDRTKEQLYTESFEAGCNLEDWAVLKIKYEDAK